MENVFITGGNGFVGLNISSQLLEKGYGVHAYVRPNANTRYLEQLPVKLYRGDLWEDDRIDEAMSECRYVIHTAGNTSCYQKDYQELLATNVSGTQNVVDAAIRSGVDRLVFTSTTSTIGCKSGNGFSADEDEPLLGYRSKSPYSTTKRQAEKIVLDSQDKDVEVIILNLAEVVGEYDHNLQWGRMILAVRYDQVPFIPPGGGSFCSSKSAALAHVSALTNGKSGERYIISGANHSYAEFVQCIATLLDREFTAPPDNYRSLKLKARLHEKFPNIFKTEPLVDPYRMRVFGHYYYFDSSKAQRELGYEPASLETMLGEAISWYGNNEFLE